MVNRRVERRGVFQQKCQWLGGADERGCRDGRAARVVGQDRGSALDRASLAIAETALDLPKSEVSQPVFMMITGEWWRRWIRGD